MERSRKGYDTISYLHNEAFAARGYATFWLPLTERTRLLPGEYGDWRAAPQHMRATSSRPTTSTLTSRNIHSICGYQHMHVTSAWPPVEEERAAMKHLTFVGFPNMEMTNLTPRCSIRAYNYYIKKRTTKHIYISIHKPEHPPCDMPNLQFIVFDGNAI